MLLGFMYGKIFDAVMIGIILGKANLCSFLSFSKLPLIISWLSYTMTPGKGIWKLNNYNRMNI